MRKYSNCFFLNTKVKLKRPRNADEKKLTRKISRKEKNGKLTNIRCTKVRQKR